MHSAVEIAEREMSGQFWKQYNALCLGQKVLPIKSDRKVLSVSHNPARTLLLYVQVEVDQAPFCATSGWNVPSCHNSSHALNKDLGNLMRAPEPSLRFSSTSVSNFRTYLIGIQVINWPLVVFKWRAISKKKGRIPIIKSVWLFWMVKKCDKIHCRTYIFFLWNF